MTRKLFTAFLLSIAALFGAASASASTITVVEFYNAGLDHYFMTGIPLEVNALDANQFPGWARTGYSFLAFPNTEAVPPGASPVCRYYGLPSAGLDTHFYSASPSECQILATDPKFKDAWELESNNVFAIYLPNLATGACPVNTEPIYRAWNDRADSNHRYSTDPAVQAQMVAKGYIAEGYGNPPVIMCSPLGDGGGVTPPPVQSAPACTLSASPSTPMVNGTVTLTATCTQSPTSYTWANCASSSSTCTTTSASAGTVTYGVTARNAVGPSNYATQSVTWQAGGGGATGTPVCTLTVYPATPQVNRAVSIVPTCTNSPTSFYWTGPCFSTTQSTCMTGSNTVGPKQYSLTASNASGAGPTVSITADYQP